MMEHTGIVAEEFTPVVPENQEHDTVWGELTRVPRAAAGTRSAPPTHGDEEGNEE